ncbi:MULTISPECIES: hypothetical protein [Halomonadaceae]|uniref:Uncharacterized protein n=1 Tax=Vreelandella glaciei TaxID=186761 RepID=A0A7Z0LSM6_9GAMM|nr:MULTISPECIES: hypothetical protein [Halomonas]NYS77902.1 hypothetical protein [Halomonas glaciei]
MWKKIVVAAMAWYLPTFAVAVESTPDSNAEQGSEHDLPHSSETAAQIKGSLDGELREWFILSHGNDSNASFIESGDHITIDITGFVDDEAWETQEALSISLTISGEGQLVSAVVLHPLGDSTSPPLYTSEGGDVEVTLTHYEWASQRVHVAGKIQGVLALQIQLDEPPSQEETIEIDVAFDVEAQKIEF